MVGVVCFAPLLLRRPSGGAGSLDTKSDRDDAADPGRTTAGAFAGAGDVFAGDGNGATEGGGTECTAAANSRSSAPSSVSSIQPRLGGGMDARRGTSGLSPCASSSVTVGISVGIPGIPGLGIGLTGRPISSSTPGSLFSSSDDAAEGEVSEVIAGGGVARLSGDAGDVGFDSCTAVSAPFSAPFSTPPAGSSISAAPRLSSASVSLSNSSDESTAGSR